MSTPDQPRDEYDFRNGSLGRHHGKLAEEGAVVRLDPDVLAGGLDAWVRK